jgi:glutathione S-transferase
MKLYYSPGSPFARKARIVAQEHGLLNRVELAEIAVSPVQGNDALAADNPLMKVPALVIDDGQALFDSRVICEYLDAFGTGPKLFPASGAARWTALRQQALGDGTLDAVILCRYELARPEDKRWRGWTDAQMRKAHQGIAACEREDLAGPRTIGQIAIACMIGYLDFRFPEEGWRNRHPKLADWYDAQAKLPSMAATRPPGS